MPIGDGLTSTNQAPHDYVQRGVTVGFFTDATLCIGCKACEVACKEWNGVPDDGYLWTGHSYDNTGSLGASSWRHVKFVEQPIALGRQVAGPMGAFGVGTGAGAADGAGAGAAAAEGSGVEALLEVGATEDPFRWVFLSDVCRHCEVAGCLEACPTGAIVRTETGGVFVQEDVCNGCGYCSAACPFGVVQRRPQPLPGAGGAFKCTFCYDRQKSGLPPACAKACPTESIQFGPLDELRERARRRLDTLHAQGHSDVRLYDPVETSVGGLHAFFLLPGDPAAFGLPSAPEVPLVHLRRSWLAAALTSLAMLALSLGAFLWS